MQELSWYLYYGDWLYLLILHNLFFNAEKCNFPSVHRIVLGEDREEVSAFCERENYRHPFCSLRQDLTLKRKKKGRKEKEKLLALTQCIDMLLNLRNFEG